MFNKSILVNSNSFLVKPINVTRSLSENRNEKLFSPNTISFNFDTEPEKLQLIFINNQDKQYVIV